MIIIAKLVHPVDGYIILKVKSGRWCIDRAQWGDFATTKSAKTLVGGWYLPAGYVEINEKPHCAAEREVFEEAGLRIKTNGFIDVSYFDDDPRENGILLLYGCAVVGGSLMTSTEILEYGIFTPDQIPDNIAGAGHKRAIQTWISGFTTASWDSNYGCNLME